MENMHDVPYIQNKDFGPEVVATMSAVAAAIRRTVPENVPLGVQVCKLFGLKTNNVILRKIQSSVCV